jgi:hypothetical protein
MADQITGWNIDKIKELLCGLIESGEIKERANDEAILYSILETKDYTTHQPTITITSLETYRK